MTNKELLDAYNASDVYDLTMCKVICARVGMHEDFYYADGGMMHGVPATIPDYVKDMYVREFKLGRVDDGRLTALEITIEGRDRL